MQSETQFLPRLKRHLSRINFCSNRFFQPTKIVITDHSTDANSLKDGANNLKQIENGMKEHFAVIEMDRNY